MVELNFWSERAANLNSIHDQLSGEKIQKVVQILELAQSTYFPAFQVRRYTGTLRPACSAITCLLCYFTAFTRTLTDCNYFPAFQRLFSEVESARSEANDNVKFLKPLKVRGAGCVRHEDGTAVRNCTCTWRLPGP